MSNRTRTDLARVLAGEPGPVTGTKAEDEPVTGFGIYPQGSHEKVRELLGKDPGVRQGRYTFDVTTWRTPTGGLAFRRRETPPQP
ncbi:MAG TPA: hypothetical protein VKD26_12200 [Streptosporangiaceae bacterium]|nr:hypothetical protein [Streptosporangiaceae bacterium]